MDGLGCEVRTGAQLLGGLEDYFQDICGLLIRAGRVMVAECELTNAIDELPPL